VIPANVIPVISPNAKVLRQELMHKEEQGGQYSDRMKNKETGRRSEAVGASFL
jgi:hypothetical protein